MMRRTLGFGAAMLWFAGGVGHAETAQSASQASAVSQIERELQKGGYPAIDALMDTGGPVWTGFVDQLAVCNRRALTLELKMLNTTNVSALEGHHYWLQVAMGRCPAVLLPLTDSVRVGELCSVSALVEASDDERRAELARRVRKLQHLAVANTVKGTSCLRAYEDEMSRLHD